MTAAIISILIADDTQLSADKLKTDSIAAIIQYDVTFFFCAIFCQSERC